MRGSVLIFSVVVLAILAMLGTTYMLIVTQSRQAASNIVRTSESDAVLQSALTQATVSIRKMVTEPSIVTPEGVFDPSKPNYVDQTYGGNQFSTNSFTYFDWDPNTNDPKAILYWNPDQVNNNSVELFTQNVVPPFFTTSPLATTAYPTGQSRPGASGFVHEGLARALPINGTNIDEFYVPIQGLKPLPKIGTIRGNCFVWISDLDAKLYSVTQDWGLDTMGTITPNLLNYPDNSKWEAEIQHRILSQPFGVGPPASGKYLGVCNFGSTTSASDATTDWNYKDTKAYIKPPLGDQDFNVFTGFLPGTQLASMEDLSMRLPSSNPPTGDAPNPMSRATVEYYFSVFRDNPDAVANKTYLYMKDHAAAININTASVEVIAAALSQIPAEKDGQTLGSDTTIKDRPWNIAQRIVSKRPFLCRMDFEDFLAAQIVKPSQLTSPPTTSPEQVDITQITDPDPSVIIYNAIGKRWGFGRIPDSDPNGNPGLSFTQSAELSVSQYLEIPGVPDTDPVYGDPAAVANGLPDRTRAKGVNSPYFQLKRFLYFFSGPRNPGVITPKEFNNIINSVTSIKTCQDQQLVEPNQGNPALSWTIPDGTITPSTMVIKPGANSPLETQPLGDDILVKHIVLGPGSNTTPVNDDKIVGGTIQPGVDLILDTAPNFANGDTVVVDGIAAGANKVCDSFIPSRRPSFYSFCNDWNNEDYFWTKITGSIKSYCGTNKPPDTFYTSITSICDPQLAPISYDSTQTPPISFLKAEAAAVPFFKMYYRMPLQPDTSTPHTTLLVTSSGPENLISWRCLPQRVPVPNTTAALPPPPATPPPTPQWLSGFYQVSFDGWDEHLPAFPGGVEFGMYASGKPNDGSVYSSALPTSGHLANGDVSWSPQFAFRSRFFGIYVLAEGLIQSGMTTKGVGQRRIEAVYDALQDAIIWQRNRTSNKHAMGDPSQPGDP